MNAEQILQRMVRVARMALSLARTMQGLGYDNSPYWDMYGETADAIYYFLEEEGVDFDQSVTHRVLTSNSYTNEQCCAILMYEYRKKFAVA